jgi:hypothetical protein
MDHQNYELVRERGSVRVAWICLGEGYNGDYDPKNPEDELLLRFDVAVKDDSIGDFVTTESRCTCFAASASAKDKEAALEILLNHFYHTYTNEPRSCMETLANKLSFISAGTYWNLSSDTSQSSNSIPLE